METNWSGEQLLQILENGANKPLPYTDNFKSNNGWINGWGKIQFGDGKMTLSPSMGETGVTTILDGTYHWRDYIFKTEISFNGTLSLLARYQDEANYISCDFTDDLVKIIEMKNGQRYVITENDFVISGLPKDYSIEVTENEVSCGVNKEAIVSDNNISSDLNNGGVGFKIWKQQVGEAQAQVYAIEVKDIKDVSYFTDSILSRDKDYYKLYFICG